MMLSTGVFCGSGDTVLMVSNARPSKPLPLPYNALVSGLASWVTEIVPAQIAGKVVWPTPPPGS